MKRQVVVVAALLMPAVAAAFPQTPAPRAPRNPAPAVASTDDEVRKLTDSVLTVMERERVIARTMGRNDPRALEELQAISLQKTRLVSRLASRCNKWQHEPEGWMGISFSGKYQVVEEAPLTMRFIGYPRIEAVEPASPAAQAGMSIGDTIVAFRGEDIRGQVVQFTSLLRPGTTLLTTVKRDGEMRTIKMRIQPRPSQSARCGGEVNAAVAAAMANPVIEVLRLDGGYEMTRRAPSPGVQGNGPNAPQTPTAVVAPMPPRVYQIGTGGGPRMLAGAEVVMTEKQVLVEMFGAENGLFVSRVLPGTPAYQSGLRAGDIIVKANGRDILSAVGLQREMAEADQRGELKLSLIRKKRPVTILLKWTGERDD